MAAWIEVITGLTLDKQEGQIQVLDNAAWLARREQLMQWGGPPETGPDQRLDPILFGPDPTARARSSWSGSSGMRSRPLSTKPCVRGRLTYRLPWSEVIFTPAAVFGARPRPTMPEPFSSIPTSRCSATVMSYRC